MVWELRHRGWRGHGIAASVGYRGGWMVTASAEQINALLRGFDRLYGLEMLDCLGHRGERAGERAR